MNKKHPKVSVIIPVYNVGRYLEACLNSVVNQTLDDIEIICVDDSSTDGSKETIERFAGTDKRIICVFHEENLGTNVTRKDGVRVSTGEYVMFLDGDDEFSLDACEKAFNAIQKAGTDMLQFGTEITGYMVSESRIKSNERFFAPFPGTIENTDLIECVWKENRFGFSLLNKIYSGSVARKAMEELEDIYLTKAEDLYAFFLIAYYSRSYSWLDDKLYRYRFGVGVTGNDYLGLDKYKICLTGKEAVCAIRRFIKEKHEEEKCSAICNTIEDGLLRECLDKWRKVEGKENRKEAFELLYNTYEDVVPILAGIYWEGIETGEILQEIKDCSCFKFAKRSKKKCLTVAFCYRNIENGGAQRVTAELCSMISALKDDEGNKKYNVVLITDTGKTENEYPINSDVRREYLPAFDTYVKEKYKERYDAWNQILDNNEPDIVITGLWAAPATLWDMLSVKGHRSHPAFIIHQHLFACVPYSWSNKVASSAIWEYMFSDGVAVLTGTDEKYIKAFNSRTKNIPNPLTFDPVESPDSVYNKEIVWVGRIAGEKRVKDAVKMMQIVTARIPDAKLYIVGSGNDYLTEEAKRLAEEMDLTDNIAFTGFASDLENYYSRASVFVSTSEMEGYCLTFREAMAHAVPVVAYDLPWLDIIRDSGSMTTVPVGDYYALADETVKLLQDPGRVKELGRKGKNYVLGESEHDIEKDWDDFFTEIAYGKDPEQAPGNLILEYAALYHGRCVAAKNTEIGALRRELQKEKNRSASLEEYIHEVKSSKTFRLGKLIASPYRLFRKAFRRENEA